MICKWLWAKYPDIRVISFIGNSHGAHPLSACFFQKQITIFHPWIWLTNIWKATKLCDLKGHPKLRSWQQNFSSHHIIVNQGSDTPVIESDMLALDAEYWREKGGLMLLTSAYCDSPCDIHLPSMCANLCPAASWNGQQPSLAAQWAEDSREAPATRTILHLRRCNWQKYKAKWPRTQTWPAAYIWYDNDSWIINSHVWHVYVMQALECVMLTSSAWWRSSPVCSVLRWITAFSLTDVLGGRARIMNTSFVKHATQPWDHSVQGHIARAEVTSTNRILTQNCWF